jgi:hypothetical protein
VRKVYLRELISTRLLSESIAVKTTAASLFHKSLYLSAIARLSLISTLASVLHDATSRKIMPLNVFKKFRLLLATWAISGERFLCISQ